MSGAMHPQAAVLVLSLAILLPFAGGLVIARMQDLSRARAWAAGVAGVVLALVVATTVWLPGPPGTADAGPGAVIDHPPALALSPALSPALALAMPGAARAALAVDALSAPLLLLLAIITLATIIARPRRCAEPYTLGALLMTEAMLIGLLTAMDFGLLTVFWIASAVPALFELRRRQRSGSPNPLRRTWAVFLLAGALPLLAASVLLAVQGWLAPAATALPVGSGTGIEIAAGVLIALAVFLRSAAVPVHGWVPVAFEHGPPGMVSLLWAAQPGAYLLARVLLPALEVGALGPAGAAPIRIILAALGVCTALYAALVGLAQTDLKRMLGFVATSHGGVLLVGLASTSVEGVGGALVLWLSSGAAITGLALVAVAVEARTGTTDMRALGGLSRPLPRLCTAFLVFGLAAVGLPGMLGFVAEDMLVHGVLASHPVVASVLLIATIFNSITVMRAYTRAFLGPTAPFGVRVPEGRDLRPRERLAVLVLAGMLLGLGLAPRALVGLHAPAAASLAGVPGSSAAHDPGEDARGLEQGLQK